jgi:hypothetical protein
MLGRSRRENRFSRGSHRPLAVASCPAPVRVQAKNSGPAAASADIAGAAAGVRSNTFIVLLILVILGAGHSAAGQWAFGLADAAPASRADAALGFSQRFAGRVLRTDLSFSRGSRNLSCRSSRVRRRGTLLRGFGTNKTWPPPTRIAWLATTGSGASAGSGPQRRTRRPRSQDLSQRPATVGRPWPGCRRP